MMELEGIGYVMQMRDSQSNWKKKRITNERFQVQLVKKRLQIPRPSQINILKDLNLTLSEVKQCSGENEYSLNEKDLTLSKPRQCLKKTCAV